MRHCSTLEHRARVCQLTLTVILAGLAAVLFLGGCGSGGGSAAPSPSVPASVWTKQAAGAAGSRGILNSVAFADASHGWAVGVFVHGAILATSDGGRTWKAQDASDGGFGVQLYSVAFTDTSHGWAAGCDTDSYGQPIAPVILATADGGTTWKAQDAKPAGSSTTLYSVAFADASHGWAVGTEGGGSVTTAAPVILATSDGGASWQAQDASAAGSSAALSSVAFVDATHGWAAGAMTDSNGDVSSPLILATSDGGITWQAQDASAAGSSTGIRSVAFADAFHGWAAGAMLNNDTNMWWPVILATLDGGATWRNQSMASASAGDSFNSIAFTDRGHGWAVGCNVAEPDGNVTTPIIYDTSDGGRTWKAQDASAAGSGCQLMSVAFSDVAHGWAVGFKLENDTYAPPVIIAAGN